jgi:hypothetical protein
MVQLALGIKPSVPHRKGNYPVAAKWSLRRFSDGFVRRAPTADEVTDLERQLPGTTIDVVARQRDWLSNLPERDSYSYELAQIHTGAHDDEELTARCDYCVQALPFEVRE